ncbi:hypothetical protein CL1_0186 [Thermococcus cleftensis]|uniref:Uncharacterized protein n=1 Tax=Thermococcus cleftensis (strain DSM 27260 / KACC 17922 / CL1) TaxID=163003 RepID=I3ZRR4_THECF|nr:hypothetical protein [Thermococcus cleftensis]AFL94398.1 hypothetical protein CL1_0186 [Thermococcus cleftensis]
MRKLHLAAAVLLVLLLAFYFGPFVFGSSKTDSKVVVMPDQVNVSAGSGFCVYPDSTLGNLVASELRSRGYRVLLLSAPVECDGQFLAVWVEWINITYFPVSSRGHIRVGAFYSSSGDPGDYLSHLNSTGGMGVLSAFNESETPEGQAYLLVDVSDESRGLIGFAGYNRHLLEISSEALVDHVERILEGGRS